MADPLVLSINEACKSLALSRSNLYTLFDSGQLPFVKIGKRRLVEMIALRKFIEDRRIVPRPYLNAYLEAYNEAVDG